MSIQIAKFFLTGRHCRYFRLLFITRVRLMTYIKDMMIGISLNELIRLIINWYF